MDVHADAGERSKRLPRQDVLCKCHAGQGYAAMVYSVDTVLPPFAKKCAHQHVCACNNLKNLGLQAPNIFPAWHPINPIAPCWNSHFRNQSLLLGSLPLKRESSSHNQHGYPNGWKIELKPGQLHILPYASMFRPLKWNVHMECKHSAQRKEWGRIWLSHCVVYGKHRA